MQGSGAPVRRQGDWNCPKCSHLVFASKKECFKCGTKKDGSSGGSAGGGGSVTHYDDWDCPECGNDVFGSNKECPNCGKWNPKRQRQHQQQHQYQQQQERRAGDWACPSCSDIVFSSRRACRKCGYARADPSHTASAQAAPGVPAMEHREGDWECAGCGYKDNFARRPTCMKCERPKGWAPREDAEDTAVCKVCLENPIDTVLKTCGHGVVCSGCVLNLDGKCPMCRAPFGAADVLKMYLA